MTPKFDDCAPKMLIRCYCAPGKKVSLSGGSPVYCSILFDEINCIWYCEAKFLLWDSHIIWVCIKWFINLIIHPFSPLVHSKRNEGTDETVVIKHAIFTQSVDCQLFMLIHWTLIGVGLWGGSLFVLKWQPSTWCALCSVCWPCTHHSTFLKHLLSSVPLE